MADKYKLLIPDIEHHVEEFPDELLRSMLEEISGLAAEHHGFEGLRLTLREEFDQRRGEEAERQRATLQRRHDYPGVY